MKIALLLALIALAGCVTSPVTPLDGGNYLVSIHTMFGITSRSTLLERATADAQSFCASRGESAKVENAVGTGVAGLTNLSGTVVFSCRRPEHAQR